MKNDIIQDTKDLWNEFLEIPRGIQRMGWTILVPLTPIIGLILLVAWALSK